MQRLRESFVVERLDEIVERCDVEGLQRELIECRDEDRGGHLVADRLEHLEAVFLRHLHVQKNKIRIRLTNDLDSLVAC